MLSVDVARTWSVSDDVRGRSPFVYPLRREEDYEKHWPWELKDIEVGRANLDMLLALIPNTAKDTVHSFAIGFLTHPTRKLRNP